MKIGIEAQRLFRREKHGTDVAALELIRALQRVDTPHEFRIFVRPGDDVCLKDSHNCRIITVGAQNYLSWEQFKLPRCVRRQGVDLLHCTANTAPLRPGVPLLLSLHDIDFLDAASPSGPQSTYQQVRTKYLRWVLPRVVPKARRIVTVSQFEKQQIMQKLKVPGQAVEVVYSGVSNRFSTPLNYDEQLRVKEQLKLPDRFFFFLGSADPRKNMPTVLKAFAQLATSIRDVKLVIADVTPGLVEAILRNTGEPELLDRIHCVGYIPVHDLPAVYHQSEVFLYPSLSESAGLPILEAMTCGVPVITSRTTAMPEVAGEAAFLVDPTSVEELTAAMKSALLDLPLRQQKIGAGLKRPALFTWERTARAMLSLYEQARAQPV
jgi:glycosyltransferase involved in cell wall biosynthesis